MLILKEETYNKEIMYNLIFVLKNQLEKRETWREERFQDFQLVLRDWKGALTQTYVRLTVVHLGAHRASA